MLGIKTERKPITGMYAEKISSFFVKDDVERSLMKGVTGMNGEILPFGFYNGDDFCLYRSATSRYGYNVKAIYGVYVDKHIYKIFIGECPHKNEDGVWVTDNNVPSFTIDSFAGSHYIEDEPDIPHIIRIETDEFSNDCEERKKEYESALSEEIRDNEKIILYCSFGTYIRGLWKRIERRFGEFSTYKGKHSNIYTYFHPRTEFKLQFINHWESKSLYFVKSTKDWVSFLYLKKNGKWSISHSKRENGYEDSCAA